MQNITKQGQKPKKERQSTMATRGYIARPVGHSDTFEAVYHHFDSYPSGLGKALWDMANGPFKGRLDVMVKTLIDNHRGGWSTILRCDWSKEPGFTDYDHHPSMIKDPEGYAEYNEHKRPQCYCHGDRNEGPYDLYNSSDNDPDGFHAYVINAETQTMTCMYHDEEWKPVMIIKLDGEEPNWMEIENT